MNLTQQIAAEDRRHEEAREKLKAEFARLMGELPDNPRINRVSKNCFVISSKDLAVARKNPRTGELAGVWGKWGVEAHDFKSQYRFLLTLLDNVSLSQGIKRIEDALKEESIRVKGEFSSHQFPLHPDVISNVRGLLKGV